MELRKKGNALSQRISNFHLPRNSFSRQGIRSKIGKWIFDENVKLKFGSKEDLVVVVDGQAGLDSKPVVSEPINAVKLPSLVDFNTRPGHRPRSMSLPHQQTCTVHNVLHTLWNSCQLYRSNNS